MAPNEDDEKDITNSETLKETETSSSQSGDLEIQKMLQPTITEVGIEQCKVCLKFCILTLACIISLGCICSFWK